MYVHLIEKNQSEGRIYSFGYYEKIDILSWCNYINENYNDKKIVIFVVSMEATDMMMRMEDRRFPNNVKALIYANVYNYKN